MNWKIVVQSHQAKTNVLPPGWDSREKVAADLGCSPDAAARFMAPLVKTGVAETQIFPVFDKILKRLVRTTAYHKVAKPPVKPETHAHGH